MSSSVLLVVIQNHRDHSYMMSTGLGKERSRNFVEVFRWLQMAFGERRGGGIFFEIIDIHVLKSNYLFSTIFKVFLHFFLLLIVGL